MKITAQELRTIIGEMIESTIEIYRNSKSSTGESYHFESGQPTEEEIDEFIVHNQLLDEEDVENLLDSGLLGFSYRTAEITSEGLEVFKRKIKDWSISNSWLGGDVASRNFLYEFNPDKTDFWESSSNLVIPNWAEKSPSYILLAIDLLRNGKFLSELNWRDFEKLIGDLLESEGWKIQITQPTRDGGIDVIAEKKDFALGKIKSVWQAKKYGGSNKVKLNEVRELSAIRDSEMATKGVMVTTNHLTNDAVKWIKRDIYRLNYKDKNDLEAWLQKYM
jgi:restriction system protein